jgi:hypothetical protein
MLNGPVMEFIISFLINNIKIIRCSNAQKLILTQLKAF